MKRFLILLMMALVCAGLAAAPTEPAAFSWRDAEKNATVQKYPDAASVLLYDVQSTVYQADGTSVETDNFFQKILTERGRRELRTMQLRYCASYGTAEFLRAEVFRPGRPVRTIDLKQHAATAVESGQMGSNIYDPNWKVVKLSIPDLAVGDTVHIVTRRTTTKPRIPDVWCDIAVLQSTDPIVYYEVRIDAPAARPLRSIAVKNEVPGTVSFQKTEKDGRIRYCWTARDVPQIFPEPKMPAYYTCAQRLLVSTVPDWQTISRWYYRLCRPRMDAVSPAMKEKVAELTKNDKTPEEKLRSIFRFVSQEIRYMGLTTEETAPGYEPHDVKTTFEKRYGVCRDKAVLLAAMLELAGLKAYPVLFMAGDPKDPEVPNNYFNHAVTAAELTPGKYTLLDPTYENTTDFLPSGEAEMSYLAATPKGDPLRLSPAASPLENRLIVRTAGEAKRNGTMKLRTGLEFSGVNDQIFRGALARWSPESRDQFFAARLKQAFPGARLTGIDVQPKQVRNTREPLKITLDYTAPWRETDEAQVILQLPDFLNIFGFASTEILEATGLNERRFPVKLYSCSDFMSEIALKLPDGVRPVALPPEKQSFRSPAATVSQQVHFAAGTLSRKFRMQTVRTRLSPEDYAEFKRLLRAWEPFADGRCFFRTDGSPADELSAFPDADAVLTRHTVLTLDSPHAGRLQTRMRIRIGNYAGMKRYSEVKIPFNPAWDDTPKIAGRVIAPDGRTARELMPAEINIMDQPWAGRLRRYPDGKILIANFPGVRPGSVIEYTIDETFRDRVMVTLEHVFAGHEPLLSDTLEVRFPAGYKPPHELAAPPHIERQGTVFRRRNALAVPREPGQPELAEFTPSWGFATGTRQDLAAALAAALAPHTVGQPDAAAKAHELCAKAATEEEKIVAIRNFVQKNIREAGPAYTDLPLKYLSDADRVLADGGGNSADRAILTKTMLDAVGVPARFVPVSNVVYTRENLRRMTELPSADDLPHLLVAAGKDYPPYYLGTGGEYDAPGTSSLENHIALDLKTGRLFALDVRQPTRDLAEQFYITLKQDGAADVQWTRRYYGPAFGQAAKMFAEFTPERRRRHWEELVSDFAQNARLTRPPEVRFDRYPGMRQADLRVTDFAAATGTRRQFELPDIQSLHQALKTAGSDRTTPFERDRGRRIELEYRIVFPAEWRPLPVPDVYVDQRYEQLTVRRRVRDNVLYVNAALELRPCRTEVLDYDRLERLQAAAGSQSLRTVVFETLQKR